MSGVEGGSETEQVAINNEMNKEELLDHTSDYSNTDIPRSIDNKTAIRKLIESRDEILKEKEYS